jgi:two-component system cell cycle sensor histidine kinase/response regulator CckA
LSDIQKILEEQDFKVQAYDIPQVALDNFRTGAYDLIVLDIKMPKIDGIKLYQEIRKVDRNVRVCFVTASEEYYTERFSELSKEKCFIQKPMSLDNFVNHIKLALAESII